MASLTIGSAPASSVFDLLRRKENDLTSAVGWCLAAAPPFLTGGYNDEEEAICEALLAS